MRAILLLCFTSFIITSGIAQSQPTMLSQSRYKIAPGGQRELEDSLTHMHSGGRVSYGLPEVELTHNPNDGVYNADESIRVYKPGGSYLVDRMTRVFNNKGQLAEYHEQVKPATLYQETFKEWYHYNQDGQLDTSWFNNKIISRRHAYIYQNGVQRAGVYENYTVMPPASELMGVDSFIANGTDSTYVLYWKFLPPAIGVYERHKYQRDANLRVVVDSFFYQGYFNSVIHTSYNAAGRKAEDSVFKAGYDHRITYRYDNNSNLVSKTRYEAVNIIRDTMTYNAINQLTGVETHTFTNNGWFPRPGSFWRYYYYGFPVGVNDVANDRGLRLYPVPATAYINIDLNFDKPENFSVRIMDMQGRIVRTWDEAGQANYTKKIHLDGMAAGNYLLQLHSASQHIARNFSVIN